MISSAPSYTSRQHLNRLSIPVHSSLNFHWTKGLGVTDRTDLVGLGPLLHQVYDDACDAGFYVVSARTGKEELFVFSKDLTDREGETIGWELVCASNYDIKIHVLND